MFDFYRSTAACKRPAALLLTALCLLPSALMAERKKAPAVPPPPPSLEVTVDASEAPRHIFHAHLTIPAEAGSMTLYYPKWIPGEHGPTGPIVDTAGVTFQANGQNLYWRRDTVDMYTYHVEVPAGVKTIEATIDYMSPGETPGGFSAGSSASSQMAVLSWNWLLFYPKGWNSDQIQVTSHLKLPQGWKYGTPLPLTGKSDGQTIDFAPASLTTLIDSPVIMGAHFREIPLAANIKPEHFLDVAAESEAALAITPEQQKKFDNLVAEAGVLYASRHYRDYHFLLSLSDHVAHFGLEHHESNDSRTAEDYFTDPGEFAAESMLLPHEYTHSWNGKYRRPAGLATPEYETPMQGDLLWVYEGLTEYLGYMLATRSGLNSQQQWLDQFAGLAADFSAQPGRKWRPLEDTATAAQLLYSGSEEWSNWRRGVDYYDEGALVWLEADVTIRQLTEGKKSLDDFTHLFHGVGGDTAPKVIPYTAEDVYAALNQVAPYDWKKFFTDRVIRVNSQAPVGGIEKGGYKLVFTAEPSEFEKIQQGRHHMLNCFHSLGFGVNDGGYLFDVLADSPAAKAGLAPGMHLVAVNGRKFTTGRLADALVEGKSSKQPLQLLVSNSEYFFTVSLDYHGGPLFPHLVRDESKPDLLLPTVQPHAAASK
jgi:predicted metalloprotease with PDZ domain